MELCVIDCTEMFILHILHIHVHTTHCTACTDSFLNLSVRPQGRITINQFQLHMISPASLLNALLLLSYLELNLTFLLSHTFPQPEGLCPGHPLSLFLGILELPSMFLWQ